MDEMFKTVSKVILFNISLWFMVFYKNFELKRLKCNAITNVCHVIDHLAFHNFLIADAQIHKKKRLFLGIVMCNVHCSSLYFVLPILQLIIIWNRSTLHTNLSIVCVSQFINFIFYAWYTYMYTPKVAYVYGIYHL